MAKYMWEFNVGDKVRDVSDGMVVEIKQIFKNKNVRFKSLSGTFWSGTFCFEVGKCYYIDDCLDECVWELYDEDPKNISPESIKELEKSIQKEKSNLNEFVENTRKNISDMEKSLEKLKKTANKIPTIEVGEMYSYNDVYCEDIVVVCVESCSSIDSYKMVHMDSDSGEFSCEWIYDNEFGTDITEFKHLNSPEQKKIAAGFYAFYTGDIPGV